MKMGFYFAEVRKLRRELQAAYGAGEYKKALILGKNILQKYMENDDANTMEYASDMHNLGVIFDTMGMYAKAVEYYKKAAILKRDCSGESLSYADTVNNLAIAYNNMGEGEKARRFHGEVLKIREAKLGKDHPDTIWVIRKKTSSSTTKPWSIISRLWSGQDVPRIFPKKIWQTFSLLWVRLMMAAAITDAPFLLMKRRWTSWKKQEWKKASVI